MGGAKPTRDKAEGDRNDVAPDARGAGDVSESREADVQDLPRNEAPRTRPRPLGGPDADPRAGENAAQDRPPSADDINLEATLLQRSTGRAGVEEWREAERRFNPGIEDERAEATPVRGPSSGASTGRVVTERETVSDDEADADATDRNAARMDDPDRA